MRKELPAMQMIPLGAGGRETTRLGFGCSSVMGALGRKESLAMLDSAFEAGVRHFDVAPSYGYGEAEGCLGEFLARHAGLVTVTTKFGIEAPGGGKGWKGVARDMARPVLKALPGLKKRLVGVGSAAGGEAARPEFTVEKARASLERSLAALRVERVDVWLLHEVEAQDLKDETLLRFEEEMVAAGKIGMFGVGSDGWKVAGLLKERAAYCPVTQYEWSVLDPLIAPGKSFRIHHRALTDNFRSLHEGLVGDTARAKRWSEHCGADVSDAETLARLMLKASLVCNPESVVLFSSKHERHVRANVVAAEDASLEEAALRLYAMVRAEVVTTDVAQTTMAGG